MLSIPEDINLHELPASLVWRECSGIVCVVAKKVNAQTIGEAKKSLQLLKDVVGSEKVCMLIDVSHTSESGRDVRDLAAAELPKLVKAIAMVSDSMLGKMLANLFFNLKSQPYPVKIFDDEDDARAWLKSYL